MVERESGRDFLRNSPAVTDVGPVYVLFPVSVSSPVPSFTRPPEPEMMSSYVKLSEPPTVSVPLFTTSPSPRIPPVPPSAPN